MSKIPQLNDGTMMQQPFEKREFTSSDLEALKQEDRWEYRKKEMRQ